MQYLLIFFTGLALAFLVCLIGAVPFYFLWNWLMPAIFGLKVITYWQAFGLMLLTNIMFKSTSSTSSK